MIQLLLASIFFVLATVHVYWATGGLSGGAAIPSQDGKPLFQPTPAQTAAVAAALYAACYVALIRFRLGTGVLTVVFFLRAIGDFHHVGLFKTNKDTPFGRWDTRLFTPLCLLISGLSLLLTLT